MSKIILCETGLGAVVAKKIVRSCGELRSSINIHAEVYTLHHILYIQLRLFSINDERGNVLPQQTYVGWWCSFENSILHCTHLLLIDHVSDYMFNFKTVAQLFL